MPAIQKSGVGVSAMSLRNPMLPSLMSAVAVVALFGTWLQLGYQEFLKTAGYGAVEVHEIVKKNWIAALGKRTELPL